MSLFKRVTSGAALWGALLTPAINASDTPKPAQVPERVRALGIENVYRLSPRLYSGGEPRGERALSTLKSLGIKTIISVDGSRPDVETARRLGIRYVHLPVGYDGVPRAQALRIIKAAQSLPGPVFLHCHHGKHRGPTAAAFCGIASEGWNKDEAVKWLKQAGTSPDYSGLFESIEHFEPLTVAEMERVEADLPELAKVAAIVEGMVEIDGHWDQLKAFQAGGFKVAVGHPDIDPPHEALQIAERFREQLRQADAKARGDDFLAMMGRSERQAMDLEKALREFAKAPTTIARENADNAFRTLGKGCLDCHKRHRDR